MKQWIRDHAIVLTLLLVLSLMILIFSFSAQPAEESDDTSRFFVTLILKILVPDSDSLDPEAKWELEHKVSFVVRKTAHLTEYAVLGFALLHFYGKYRQRYAGQIFYLYLVWYGFERMIVEGLRYDSLYLWNTGIRVSQVLSAVIVLVGIIMLIKNVFSRLLRCMTILASNGLQNKIS